MILGNDSATRAGGLSSGLLRRFLLIFLPAVVLLGSLVALLYYQELANEKLLFQQEAAHIVDLQAEIISREFKSVESDILYLAGQAKLREFVSGGAGAKAELEDEYLLFCRNKAMYDQIRCLDENGSEAVRINYHGGNPAIVDESELQPKGTRYYFAETMLLERGEVFISPFDLNVEHGEIERPLKPVIRFATPVFDASGTKRGILVLNYLGARLVRNLIALSARFPGRAMLTNQDGFFLIGRNPADEWGFMFGHDRTFEKYYPQSWRRIAAEVNGQFQNSDGLFTFQTISSPARRTLSAGTSDSRSGADGSAAHPPPALVVVSSIPKNVLEGNSTQLLRRLLLLLAVAAGLLLVLAWYLAHAGALRREHERQIAQSEARLRTLSTRLLTAQEDERRIISRDLHDELGQVVTAISLDLERSVQSENAGKKEQLVERALERTRCLLDSVHEISARVRPTILDDLGLKDAVQTYLVEYEQTAAVAVKADLRFDRQDVPATISENVYRILQEALANVRKHSGSPGVSVTMHVAADGLTLSVRDAGAGFRPQSVNGDRLGLLGMQERAELLGGNFTVTSEPGKGTEIRVAIRFDRAESTGTADQARAKNT